MKRHIPVSLLFLVLASCQSEVMPAQKHPDTTASMVKVYQDPPKRYEVLGTVSMRATSQIPWADDTAVDLGIDLLKVSAASQGANGMLLKHPAHKEWLWCKYLGKTYVISIERVPERFVYAQAIYVHEEW